MAFMGGGVSVVGVGEEFERISLEDIALMFLVNYMCSKSHEIEGLLTFFKPNEFSFTIKRERTTYGRSLEKKITIEKDPLIPYKIVLRVVDDKLFNGVSCHVYDLWQRDIIGILDYDKKKDDKGAIPVETIYNVALGNYIPFREHEGDSRHILGQLSCGKQADFVNIKSLLSDGIYHEKGFAYFVCKDDRVSRKFLENLNCKDNKIREVA